MSSLLVRLRQKGVRGTVNALRARAMRPVHLLRVRDGTEYRNPDEAELRQIEAELRNLGVAAADYAVDAAELRTFRERFRFPVDYHGGVHSGVYDEKILEHFVAWDLLDLRQGAGRAPYVDIAGAASPWTQLLREDGIEAYCVDLAPHPSFARLGYYIACDATSMPFGDGSIGSASLQCAFEMFVRDSDTRLVMELGRVLRPGGRVVIVPLYMHTHACYYQSPEYFDRVSGDAGAVAYVRRSSRGVQASRKYSPRTLIERVLEPAKRVGLTPRLRVLRDKNGLGEGIYLHFILILEKADASPAGS